MYVKVCNKRIEIDISKLVALPILVICKLLRVYIYTMYINLKKKKNVAFGIYEGCIEHDFCFYFQLFLISYNNATSLGDFP